MSVQSVPIRMIEQPLQSSVRKSLSLPTNTLNSNETKDHFIKSVLPELKTKVAEKKSNQAKRVLDITMRHLDEQSRASTASKNPFLQDAYSKYEKATTPEDRKKALGIMSYALQHDASLLQLAPAAKLADLFPGSVPTLYGDAKQKGYTQITAMLDNAAKKRAKAPVSNPESYSIGTFPTREDAQKYFDALDKENVTELAAFNERLAEEATIRKQKIAASRARRAQKAQN